MGEELFQAKIKNTHFFKATGYTQIFLESQHGS